MSRRRFYTLVAALVLVGVLGITFAPEATLVLLSIAVPASILSAFVSVVYLRRVYRRQREPRSRFFRMLLELFAGLLVIGAWIGYLTIARLTERAFADGTLSFHLPAPGPVHSAPISALIVVAVFAAPVRFAFEVWLVRRFADDDDALDREPV